MRHEINAPAKNQEPEQISAHSIRLEKVKCGTINARASAEKSTAAFLSDITREGDAGSPLFFLLLTSYRMCPSGAILPVATRNTTTAFGIQTMYINNSFKHFMFVPYGKQTLLIKSKVSRKNFISLEKSNRQRQYRRKRYYLILQATGWEISMNAPEDIVNVRCRLIKQEKYLQLFFHALLRPLLLKFVCCRLMDREEGAWQ